ncbi:hypothetical protein OH77DRAFT_1263225 [Trametes cingulata]|nr:hypothetical protein OH77DRAFT_1263225 [Trametes cingulata]
MTARPRFSRAWLTIWHRRPPVLTPRHWLDLLHSVALRAATTRAQGDQHNDHDWNTESRLEGGRHLPRLLDSLARLRNSSCTAGRGGWLFSKCSALLSRKFSPHRGKCGSERILRYDIHLQPSSSLNQLRSDGPAFTIHIGSESPCRSEIQELRAEVCW